MKFRLRAFSLHLLASACVLTLVLGGLYVGWYQWPGWYLTGVFSVSALLATVDLALGPLLTLVIANPAKPRRELARDIAIIATAQLAALAYGSATLWSGRPLFYTFSLDRLEVVRAFEIDTHEIDLARQQNPGFAPHWYSRPRWVWALYPADPKEANAIFAAAANGAPDVVDMPRMFKSWGDGLPELRRQLKTADKLTNVSGRQIAYIKSHMRELGFAPDAPITMIMTGREEPLVAVFDPASVQMKALLRVPAAPGS